MAENILKSPAVIRSKFEICCDVQKLIEKSVRELGLLESGEAFRFEVWQMLKLVAEGEMLEIEVRESRE